MIVSRAIELTEAGKIPDQIVRLAMRQLIRKRLRDETRRYRDPDAFTEFYNAMSASPVTLGTVEANEQHYEVPTDFFKLVLGKRLKYSCALFDAEKDSLGLNDAEESMLGLTATRARLEDGQDILELGCGWGSMTLWMAEQYPNARITAVSNSSTQKIYIEQEAKAAGLTNVSIITSDVNDFETAARFDRVISIEMFEHVRNHAHLFKMIQSWLKPGGKLFFHIFCHRSFPYFFEDRSDGDWMAKHFFTGGLMPSYDLPVASQDSLILIDRWPVNGKHYALTCERWLENCDSRKDEVLHALEMGNSPEPANIQRQRWRMFFMACSELFGLSEGNEWHVGHYLFENGLSDV